MMRHRTARPDVDLRADSGPLVVLFDVSMPGGAGSGADYLARYLPSVG